MKNNSTQSPIDICFIADRYPVKDYPANTFLEQLVAAVSQLEVNCCVIAPYNPLRDKLTKRVYNAPAVSIRQYEGKTVTVYCPPMVTPTSRKILGIPFAKIHLAEFQKVIEKTMRKYSISPDVFYGHFIKPSGLTVAALGEKYGKPSFVAYGESSIQLVSGYDRDFIKERLSHLTGVVAVSSKNKAELVESGFVEEAKIAVFPNAIDTKKFKKLDKKSVRQELGYQEDDFIVAFTGHFIHRKGSKRVSAALDQLTDVKSIFIGAGEEPPACQGILFQGRLNHDEICKYLNAADVFVLPTLAEGCCNAIVEAMACGLPIISSNRSFNDDILDDECAIRIDPESIDEIRDAISLLHRDQDRREAMSRAARKKAEGLTISERARKIASFLNIGGQWQ